MTPDRLETPATEAGKRLLEHMTEDAAGYVTLTSGRFTIAWVLDALRNDIPRIETEARAPLLRERLALEIVRRTMIDRIGVRLSQELAQGSPFEPMDRLWVAKVVTRVLDEERRATDVAALSPAAPGTREDRDIEALASELFNESPNRIGRPRFVFLRDDIREEFRAKAREMLAAVSPAAPGRPTTAQDGP